MKDINDSMNVLEEGMMDPFIARRIKDMRLGLNGRNVHSWRAVSIRVTGRECQMTGKELCQIAQEVLGEEWEHE